jgi:MFS family permease
MRWLRITPILFVTFSFAYLDRVNFSFAAAGGIAHDLALSPSMVSLVGALFFFGYFTAQVPGALLAERYSPKIVIFACLVAWGGFSALTGVVNNVWLLLAVRFLLGAVEAAVFPALLMFVNCWFARSERSLANSFIILSTPVTVLWMSIVSGYLVKAFGWRMMFVAEGLPASVWGVMWWFLVQDRPAQAKWLAPAERDAIEAQILADQKDLKVAKDFKAAIASPFVLRFATLYFFWGVSLFGFILWLPTIIKEAGTKDIVTIGWLSSAPYLATTLVMPVVSVLSDRAKDRRQIVAVLLAISGAAFLGLYALRGGSFWVSYPLLCLAGIGPIAALAPFFAIPADVLPKSVAGGASALINSLGALGGFAGSYLVGWSNGLTHDPASSFLMMGLSLVVAVVLLMRPLKL